MDAPLANALIGELELLFALVGLNDHVKLTKIGRRVALEEKRRELDNKVVCLERKEKDCTS